MGFASVFFENHKKHRKPSKQHEKGAPLSETALHLYAFIWFLLLFKRLLSVSLNRRSNVLSIW